MNSLGIIGRFKPLHNGNALLLRNACTSADKVVIAIGSSNKYDSRNPFSPEEVKEMLELYLSDFNNFEIKFLPDTGHIPEFRDGKKWVSDVKEIFSEVDVLVTGNPYVADLLKNDFKIIDSYKFNKTKNSIHATNIRKAIVNDLNWEKYIPKKVATFIKENKLDERLRIEFKKEILAEENTADIFEKEIIKVIE